MASPVSKRVCIRASTASFKIDDDSSPIKVYPEGDVILRTGCEHAVQLIQVSSAVLSAASDFFVDIFAANLIENNVPSSSSCPKEVPMTDDNPQAMLNLCKILHHHSDEVKANDGRTAIELAAVCIKYDCYRPVKLWMFSQIREQYRLRSSPLLKNSACNPMTFPDIMAVSYLFHDPQHFWLTSKSLIATQLVSAELRVHLPDELIG